MSQLFSWKDRFNKKIRENLWAIRVRFFCCHGFAQIFTNYYCCA